MRDNVQGKITDKNELTLVRYFILSVISRHEVPDNRDISGVNIELHEKIAQYLGGKIVLSQVIKP
jgi:hypothetical protein